MSTPEPLGIESALRQYWGYETLRSPQHEVVQALWSSRDTLVVLPTGMGKSLCFQLPAVLQSGLTIVVSPLIALMENQVQELQSKQLPAACLHSQLEAGEKKRVFQKLERNSLRLLYLAPETLLSPPLWERLCQPQLVIHSLILDEAHCLVEWGESFRPAYQRLGTVRPALLQSKPPGTRLAIAAFTATADPQTQRTIQAILGLQDPVVIKQNPYRHNLHLSVQMSCTPRDRQHQIQRWIENRSQDSGLVYVRSRRDTDAIAAQLRVHQEVEAYHAGLASSQRRQIEHAWLSGALKVVVCTSAFGLGINKPDCRWVVHYQPPLYLSEYLQEIGRAGRDGLRSDILLLRSEPTGWLDPRDRQQRQFLISQWRKAYRRAQACLRQLPHQGNIVELKRQIPEAEAALGMLQRMNQIEWVDPFHYRVRSTTGRSPRSSAIPKLPVPIMGETWQVQALEAMQRFLNTSECRWRYLLQGFGFSAEAHTLTCGHCDNCLRKLNKY